ncbi:MAG: hypothetical protein ACYTBJ_26260 [Planctomycetota bacterium]|jgi:hypothetical protein
MPKKQLHIRASERLQHQLAALTTGGATVTEVVTIAVDRMYREETAKVKHIKIEHSESALWGATDPVEDGYDESESLKTFEAILDGYLTEAYPGAEIEIVKSINDRIFVDGDYDHKEIPWINQIVEKAWNADWLVGV